MPRRVTPDRKRPSDLPAWETYFLSGWDYFDNLPESGIDTDAYGRPDRDVALEAWGRLGTEFLAKHAAEQATMRHPDEQEPWALREFGTPKPLRERRRYTY